MVIILINNDKEAKEYIASIVSKATGYEYDLIMKHITKTKNPKFGDYCIHWGFACKEGEDPGEKAKEMAKKIELML